MADSSSLQVVEERRSSVSPLGNGRDTHVEETDSLSDFEDFTDEYPSLKTLDGVEESGERVRTAVPFDASKTIKTGYLDHSGKTFQRWSKKYLRIYGNTLFLSKSEEDTSGQQVVLKEAVVSENSTKNVNHSFTVLTPSHQVVLAASSRKEMEQWISAFRSAAASQVPIHKGHQLLDGSHSWFMCSHTRPMYCNVCRVALHGVAWHGMSCEVCKIKSHRRCVFGVSERCKWTTRASMEEANAKIGYDFSIPHQWVEGNLPASSKCAVCLRTCGSVRRLQDFRCLWCKYTVHTECMERVEGRCSLGDLRLSVLPPSSLQQSDVISKGMWEPYKMIGHSPVLALVNSKSGDNQGVRFLRKLKYWLNPVQVLDLACSGPDLGLQLFQRFDKFRIIVFGGDGSIGWVLSAVDRYNLHSKTMVGVAPLGTGNDMARVMGWGAQFGDEEKLPIVLKEMECSSFHLLDRWSVQFTMATNVDMSPIVGAMTPSITQPSSISSCFSQQDIPLPGPDSVPPTDDPTTTTTPSSSNSDLEYQTPSPELAPGGQDFTRLPGCSTNNDTLGVVPCNAIDAEGFEMCALPLQPSDELCSLPANGMGRGHNGMEHRQNRTERGQDGRPGTETEQIELVALQTALAGHLSTILVSPEEAAVLAATEVVCQTVDEVINIALDNGQRKKPMIPNCRDDPLVQQCIILQQKLKDLLQLLKEEAKAATRPKQNGESESERVRVLRPQEALLARADSLKRAMATVVSLRERERERGSSAEREREGGSLVDHSALRLPVSSFQSSPNLSPCSSQSSLEMGAGPHGRMSVTSQGASSIGSVVDPVPVLRETKEIACMNNYFGIGVDAEIAYQFHTSREKNPAQFKNRTKNKMRYGLLAGKQFTASVHKNLERRISLECDGRLVVLPQRLQGLVFLNIPSYMAGTNFWGTDREKRGFSAPSYDDKLMEVACITGFTQIATAKVLGIQNRRLAQCRYAKITLNERLPVQVDGEAWLQNPGIVIISHKNKARMIFKDKTFSQSLESWKQKHHGSGGSGGGMPVVARPVGLLDYLTEEDVARYRKMSKAVRPLMELIKQEGAINQEVARLLVPLLASTTAAMDRVFPAPDQVSETADIEHVQEMQRVIKSILQETLWLLDTRKISVEREPKIRECVQRLEGCIRDFQLHDPFASHNHRRASDSLLFSNPSSCSSFTSSYTTSSSPSAHRGRTALIVPPPAISAANMAKKVGKEVEEWNSEDVAWWLSQLGLSEYRETVISHDIRGPQLRDMQTSDLQGLGITKVGHLTKLRAGIQALNPSIYISPRCLKRGKHGCETR